MERIYNRTVLAEIGKQIQFEKIFDTKGIEFFACRYQKGEYLCQPCEEKEYLQIIIHGTISIYHIRDDGSKYSVAQSEGLYLLGDMEFSEQSPSLFFVEAMTATTTIEISLKKYRSILQSDVRFLNFLVSCLSRKLSLIARGDVCSISLEERVLNHIEYHCGDGVLSGIEKTSFQLHCSSRQLQRVLNNLEARNVLKKCGKGEYRLL